MRDEAELLSTLLLNLVPNRDFLELQEQVCSEYPINTETAEKLVSLPLAALFGLVELRLLRRKRAFRQENTRAIILINFSAQKESTFAGLLQRLELVSQFLPKEKALWIQFDGWRDTQLISEILPFIQILEQKASEFHSQINFITPPLNECALLAKANSIPLDQLFSALRDRGFVLSAPGPWTDYESSALEHGIVPSVQFDLSYLGDQFHVASGPNDRGERHEDSILLTRHVGNVLEVRDELESWVLSPIWLDSTDRQTLRSPFALPLAKAIAISRLILPDHIAVEGPPLLLGRHLAQLLSNYRISSLGSAAADLFTAETLKVPLLSEVDPLAADDVPYRRM